MEIQMIHFKREYNHYKNATNYPDGICIISYFGKVCKKKYEKVDTIVVLGMNTDVLASGQFGTKHFIATIFLQLFWYQHRSPDL